MEHNTSRTECHTNILSCKCKKKCDWSHDNPMCEHGYLCTHLSSKKSSIIFIFCLCANACMFICQIKSISCPNITYLLFLVEKQLKKLLMSVHPCTPVSYFTNTHKTTLICHKCLHICLHICLYICLHILTHVYTHVCTHVYTHVYKHVYTNF